MTEPKQRPPLTERELVRMGMRHAPLKIDRTVFAKTEEEKLKLKQAKKDERNKTN